MQTEPGGADAGNESPLSLFRSEARSIAPRASPPEAQPHQLALPGFRDRPFMGAKTPNKVARWVLRVLARTEARDVYLARNRRFESIDGLLRIDSGHRPQ